MNNSCTALIPFHNEKKRILNVLNVLFKIETLSQIICVDDGSSDKTYSLIKKQCPLITVVRLKKNMGKSAAVDAGLRKVRTEYVFLCDADLHHLKKSEVERAIRSALKSRVIDLLILRRTHSIFQTKLSRGDILFSGERIMKTKDLINVFKSHPRKYQLEIAINKYMIDNKKSVRWLPSSALSTFKIYKVGLFLGTMNEWKMITSMFTYAGWHEYWRQFLLFCHEKHSRIA